MFYWKHEEAAYYGQSQVEGNGSLALGHDNCQKPKWRFRQHGKKSTFFLDKDRQECSTLVMATRLPRSTPHLEQVTLTGPWLTHPVLQGSQMTDSYSTMQVLQCWMPAPGATSSHWMWLLYASPYEPDLQCVPLNNTKVLKDFWRRSCGRVGNKFVFGFLQVPQSILMIMKNYRSIFPIYFSPHFLKIPLWNYSVWLSFSS